MNLQILVCLNFNQAMPSTPKDVEGTYLDCLGQIEIWDNGKPRRWSETQNLSSNVVSKLKWRNLDWPRGISKARIQIEPEFQNSEKVSVGGESEGEGDQWRSIKQVSYRCKMEKTKDQRDLSKEVLNIIKRRARAHWWSLLEDFQWNSRYRIRRVISHHLFIWIIPGNPVWVLEIRK